MPIVLSNLTLPTGLTFEGVTYDAPPGQQQYTTPGTYSWTAPAGITSVSVVCVAGGGSGGASGGASGSVGYGGAYGGAHGAAFGQTHHRQQQKRYPHALLFYGHV